MSALEGAEVGNLILRVAVRNLWLYRVKTFVIALLLAAGSCLAIVGLSLLRGVETSMRESIIESVSGHLQVYSGKAKDDLALFGGAFLGRDDIGFLADLANYRDVAMANPDVQDFVPMGIDVAILGRGNEMDDVLEALRGALKSGDEAAIRDRVAQVRFQLRQLELELAERRKLFKDTPEEVRKREDLAKALAPGFLEGVRPGDEDLLQFLEARIAPLSGEKAPIYMNYLGTDVELHRANFAKFAVVEGEALAAGRRGIMISQKFRENFAKNLAARIFDRLEKRVVKAGIPIAGDPENTRDAGDLPRQYSTLVSQLDAKEAADVSERLAGLGFEGAPKPGEGSGTAAGAPIGVPNTEAPVPGEAGNETDLVARVGRQLQEFLAVDDATLFERKKIFYEIVAPRIKLYEISPGETIVLRSYTRSGYIKSVPLQVSGVFTFKGIEDSELAGAMNIIDLVSFRELYGQMNEASRKELEEMRAQSGVRDVSAESAEDALFGSGAAASVESAAPEPSATSEGNAGAGASTASGAGDGGQPALVAKPSLANTFDPQEVKSGLALNAAIKLKDIATLPRTKAALERAYKEAGLDVKVVDWQQASGIVGQFVNITRAVLVFAIVVIFVVALVIINNGIIISTFNRIQEIGTMRAIGAQRSFVRDLFLAETGLTSVLGAALGAIVAIVLLAWMGRVGIPASNDVVTFLFSGPRLHPSIRWGVVLVTPVVVALVATITSLYAARHAARIKPVEAMQEKE